MFTIFLAVLAALLVFHVFGEAILLLIPLVIVAAIGLSLLSGFALIVYLFLTSATA